jgi:hypothetical protein
MGEGAAGGRDPDFLVRFGEQGVELRGGLRFRGESALFGRALGAGVRGGGDAFGDLF